MAMSWSDKMINIMLRSDQYEELLEVATDARVDPIKLNIAYTKQVELEFSTTIRAVAEGLKK